MGLPVDRVKFLTYVQSGVFAGLAAVILAAQFGAGQPAEGVGWELFSIAAVVVGRTLLTGGVGSVATTLAGVLMASSGAARRAARSAWGARSRAGGPLTTRRLSVHARLSP